MNAKQLADYLGMSYSSFWGAMKDNPSSVPPYVVIGKTKRWYLATVDSWLLDNTGSDSSPRNAREFNRGAILS